MARQNFYSQPWRKNLEVFQDFSGGLNTEVTNEKLLDKEFTTLVNMDLDERGSVKRRYGCKTLVMGGQDQINPQGFFRWFRENSYMYVYAADGKLYYPFNQNIPIEGMPNGFQKDKPIEAAQLGEILYIATGSGLVQYDGVTAKKVVPYKPDPLEALEIGTNGLADNPNAYLEDGESVFLRIDGVIPLDISTGKVVEHGVSNKDTHFDVYVSKPAGSTVEFRFEVRRVGGSDTWELWKDWSTNRRHRFNRGEIRDYELRFLARVQGNETDDPVEYYIPRWSILQTRTKKDDDVTGINSCDKIITHHNRLYLYGSKEQRYRIFVSHLNQGDYFPVANTLDFENPKAETLTKLVKYQNAVLGFTRSTIQALYGRSADDWRRSFLNTTIGAIAPESVRVSDNQVFFLSVEGVYRLKSLQFDETRANVEKVDTKIDKEIKAIGWGPKHDAIGLVHEGQYHLYFPSEKIRYRYYVGQNVWVKDTSEYFDISKISVQDGEVVFQRKDSARFYTFDKELRKDVDHIFESKLETKYFTFGQPYHQKKLKELHLLLGHFRTDVPLRVYLYADAYLALKPSKERAVLTPEGFVEWEVVDAPNLDVPNGTIFGEWDLGHSPLGEIDAAVHELKVNGKCRRTKLVITHQEDTPFTLLGIGYIFKIKGV